MSVSLASGLLRALGENKQQQQQENTIKSCQAKTE